MALGGALALADKRYRQERLAARAGQKSVLGAAH
jgi:hypothetical protein